MYTWNRKERAARLKEATVRNPKLKKLLKYSIEDQEEIISIFLKVKGNAQPYYKSILNVEYFKISKIKRIFSNDTDLLDTVEIVQIITGLCYKKIVNLRTLDVIKIFNFVKDGIKQILELESSLSRRPEADEVKAGLEDMNEFSELISVKSAMDFYNEKWEEVEKRPYSHLYAVWKKNVKQSDFDKAYFKIKTAPKPRAK